MLFATFVQTSIYNIMLKKYIRNDTKMELLISKSDEKEASSQFDHVPIFFCDCTFFYLYERFYYDP